MRRHEEDLHEMMNATENHDAEQQVICYELLIWRRDIIVVISLCVILSILGGVAHDT